MCRRLLPLFLIFFLTVPGVISDVHASIDISLEGTSYRDRDQLINDFISLTDKYYPVMRSVVYFDYSVEGRPLYVFTIGDEDKPAVMFDAACHGDERLPSEVLYYYAKWLLESGSDVAKRIRTSVYTVLVPIVNVDGYPTVRKNAHGVDLNRNFDWHWGETATSGGGSSTNPGSPVYIGPSVESEPETKLYHRVWEAFKPKFYVNFHTGDSRQLWYSRTGSSSARDYLVSVYDKYRAESLRRGEPSYPVSECGGTGCFDCVPYADYGIYGWSAEMDTAKLTNKPYSEVIGVLEVWLPLLITLSDESVSLAAAENTRTLLNIFLVAAAVLAASVVVAWWRKRR